MPPANMNWLYANVAILWVFVLVQGVLTLALLRQVGLVSLRIGPKGARVTDDGLSIGEEFPLGGPPRYR